MKRQIEICDACGQEMKFGKTTCEYRLPIMCNPNGARYMVAYNMDLCEECASIICKTYYEIAHKHNSTGRIALSMGEDDDE